MGLFLSMSGIIGSSFSETESQLKALCVNSNYENLKPHKCQICEGKGGTTILFPEFFGGWDAVSATLSEKLHRPVFSFHVHDGDLWMFILFSNGKEVAWFNPIPDYWEKISEIEKQKWSGNAELISKYVPSLSPEDIQNYLTFWDDDIESKAYPSDEFTYGDCWQIVDFMKHFGLEYPAQQEFQAIDKNLLNAKFKEFEEERQHLLKLEEEVEEAWNNKAYDHIIELLKGVPFQKLPTLTGRKLEYCIRTQEKRTQEQVTKRPWWKFW